jgi:hypothetical protein
MTSNATPPKLQFFDANGAPLVGGKLYTYAAGTTTPLATYTDYGGGTANANPVILDSRGEASVWLGTALYKMALYSATDVLIWTVDNIGGFATLAQLAASGGSNLIGFLQAGTGAVATTVQTKLRESVSVLDFMTAAQIADVQAGTALVEVTAAVQAAMTASVTLKKICFFPGGTYLCGTLTTAASMSLLGEGSKLTTIKAKASLNAGLLVNSGTEDDDLFLQGIRFDGNKANNSSGTTVSIYGSRPTVYDVVVVNSPATAITTNWNYITGANRLTGAEGRFERITIDSPNGTGWIHNGPGDSRFDQIVISDPGLGADNTYYGIQFNSTGRCSDIHCWNRDATSVIAIASVYVNAGGTGGLTFTNCHFEAGYTNILCPSSGNTFSGCFYYAPRGPYCVTLTGNNNILTGVMGVGAASARPNYAGIKLVGSWNQINVSDLGCTEGAIDFSTDAGQNIVNVTGFKTSGVSYIGTPPTSDQVVVQISGAGGGTFTSFMPAAWNSYTPTVTAQTGSITTKTATGKYKTVGKICHVSIQVNITTNGTGAGTVNATLPFAAAATNFVISGRELAISGISLAGTILASGSLVQISGYANSYPGGDNAQLVVTGTYEII